MSSHQHANQAVAKGIIRRTFVSRERSILSERELYTTMVRRILEYGNAPREHQFAGDIDKIERVLRRATSEGTTL